MSYPSNNNSRCSHRGFSLVEVVLAIAIVAIGLVSILGLFPQGLNSARNAADDSLTAILAQDVIARRKIDIQSGVATIGVNPAPYWFLADGTETNAYGADNHLAMFKCDVLCTTVPSIPKLETTEVRIVWPWFQKSTDSFTPLNTNIFTTEIAAYQ